MLTNLAILALNSEQTHESICSLFLKQPHTDLVSSAG